MNWTANLLTGNDWLFLSTARGTSTTAQPGTLVLSPGPNTANLSAGPHYALIQIADQVLYGFAAIHRGGAGHCAVDGSPLAGAFDWISCISQRRKATRRPSGAR